MSMMITFIVPLIHPESARNWSDVLERLQETLSSIDNACRGHKGVGAVVVANKEAELDSVEFPSTVSVARVSLGPPARSVFKGDTDEADRIKMLSRDKGHKVATGVVWALDRGSEYVMNVDADDLVSRHIIDHVKANRGKNGWYVDKGWMLPHRSKVALLLTDFYNWCGTFAVVKTSLFDINKKVEDIPDKKIREIYGHHRFLLKVMREKGVPLEPFGFPVAAYIVDHGGGTYGRKSLFRDALSIKMFFRWPRKYLARMMMLSRFGRDKDWEFGRNMKARL
ncbi:hypothetical protein [Marinimicrobium alkaliphilum]|uniref:hypothetical protein n=1 Tax=Marinimicrobium alkaliphilum TaxID=2202654 RepID=UPI000DBA95BD|nr:hypothetical protein [Marinimicrobium alkaliphilum]